MASRSELLSPAEAALLHSPASASASICLQAALLTLITKHHLWLDETGSFFKRKLLHIRNGDGQPLAPHLECVKNALIDKANHRVLKPAEVAAALRNAFGNDYRRYVHDHVAPALIERGLLRREDRKWLGLIPYVHYHHSLAGQLRARRIRERMDELAGMKLLIRENPYRARRLAAVAGVLLILSPAARKQASKIKAMLGHGSDGSTSTTYFAGGDDQRSEEWQLDIDVGVLDGNIDCLQLLDGIECAGDFTGGDGSDSGGDGGGGD